MGPSDVGPSWCRCQGLPLRTAPGSFRVVADQLATESRTDRRAHPLLRCSVYQMALGDLYALVGALLP